MAYSEMDTIVAIATPPGEGGIGVIRLSGPKAPEFAAEIYRGKMLLKELPSHQLTMGAFIKPQTEEILDRGMLVWMHAPRSFTGEEVIEFHAHGGPLLLNRILRVLLDLGARLAEPGEFTRRAFLNGKLDLLQAEAVGEMIAAKSEAALANARSQLEGRLSRQIEELRERLLHLLARVEAAIDFPEEDIELLEISKVRHEVRQIEAVLLDWREKFNIGRLLREGVRVALVGRPNVGKSSLLNRLLNEERAIVHATPGTTRDVIDAFANWGGVSFHLFDTAGIREGKEDIEREGIARSKRIAAQADLTLWVIDSSQPFALEDEQVRQSLSGRYLLVFNKIDRELAEEFKNPQSFLPLIPISVSAKTGAGLDELKEAVLAQVGLGPLAEHSFAYLNNARHLEALNQALSALNQGENALIEGLPSECVAADLQRAKQALETLIGKLSSEEILDRIFSEFCIGK